MKKADVTNIRTGAAAIAEALVACNIEIIFGYPGGGTNLLIDAIVGKGPRSMSARTELSAAWMSYGYNRAKRRAASACLFHCVGTLHASPVVYGARLDSTPFVLMDVSLDSSLDLREGLQESGDLFPTLKQIAKFARKIVVAEDLPLAVRQAVVAASTGRPGSSVLDFAFQVLTQKTDCRIEALTLPRSPAASEADVNQIVSMILEAKSPLLIVGAGVHAADASAEIAKFTEATGIPVVSTSWGGRGVLPDTHPSYGGPLGSFGWITANELAQEADLWIAVGVSFSQMTTAAWNLEKPEKVIQIDVDSNQLGKIFQPTLGIVADAKIAMGQINDAMSKHPTERNRHQSRLNEIGVNKKDWFAYLDSLANERDVPINQYYLLKVMSRVLPPGTMIVGDSGMHCFMMYRAFRFLESTPLVQGSRYQSLGSGLPIAIGAKLAMPDKTVVCFHGDGGLYYDISDLSFLAERGIKVILIIDDNRSLAANRSSAIMMKLENPWVALPDQTDFIAVAKGFGIQGEKVEDPKDLEGALVRALESEHSYVLDIATDPDTRISRAVKDVVPIISDRIPQAGGEGHVSPTIRRSWPK